MFSGLSHLAQIRRLRAVALRAAELYGLDASRVQLINWGFNATFRIDTTGGAKFALRINVNSQRSEANILAEVAWIAALARDTGLTVPRLQVPKQRGTQDTSVIQWICAPELDRASVPAVLFSWLPGRDLGRTVDPAAFRALGKTMALLHRHGEQWRLPSDGALSHANDVLFGQPNRFLTDPMLTPQSRGIFEKVRVGAQATLNELYRRARPQILHFDLHTWNVKWVRGRLAVFDFDDCCIGVPVQDLATTVYYLCSWPEAVQLENALLEGYSLISDPPLPDSEIFEALLAARALLLSNDLLAIETANEKEHAPEFLSKTEQTLSRFLDSGRFAPAGSNPD